MKTLFHVLLESSIRVSLVAAIVAFALLVAKVRSSGLRHAAWVAVLCSMPLMPFLPYIVPAVPVPITAGAPASGGAMDSLTQPAPFSTAEFVRTNPPGASPQIPAASPASREPAWPAPALGIYAAVALVLLWRLLAGWFAVQRVVRSSRQVPGQNAAVFESSLVSAPVTVGLAAQRILLPTDWCAWPAEKLRAVLAHEFAHVARRDTVTSLLAQLNRCIFWFHPLAWWLERHLAFAAEQACDDAAVRAIGERRRYAQVLLEIAGAVRLRGRLVTVQGVGAVDGAGMLDRRIDRILQGSPVSPASRIRKIAVACFCASAILLVAACRQQSIYSVELKPDPAYAKQQAEQKAAEEFSAAARNMNATQVAEAEAALAANPQDLDTRKKLMIFYQSSGRKVLGDENTIAQFRTHKLWWIQNHPDDPYASLMNPLSDPAGFEQARKLWLAVLERKDAPVPALLQAVAFFQNGDQPRAKKVLVRVRATDPNGNWTSRLASLYAQMLAGAPTPYAQVVRDKLAASADPDLLAETGVALVIHGRRGGGNGDSAALGESLLLHVVQLNPNSTRAQSGLALLRETQQRDPLPKNLGNQPSEAQYQAAAALPEAERFHALPALAEQAHIRGDMSDYYDHNPAAAHAAWELARRYAQDTLRLAPSKAGDATYGAAVFKANMTLGSLSMRVDGDAKAAARYLRAASQAPVRDNTTAYSMLKLPVALIKYGGPAGREAVIEYLERYGQHMHRTDMDLLRDARQLRQGYMPIWYQYQSAKLK